MTVFAGQSETTRLKNLILIWAEPEDWFILQVSLLGNVVGKSEGPFDFNSGINIPDKCRSICVFFWHLAVVKISTSLLSQRSLTPTVRLVVAAVRPLRAEGPELLRGMNYLFFFFFWMLWWYVRSRWPPADTRGLVSCHCCFGLSLIQKKRVCVTLGRHDITMS